MEGNGSLKESIVEIKLITYKIKYEFPFSLPHGRALKNYVRDKNVECMGARRGATVYIN